MDFFAQSYPATDSDLILISYKTLAIVKMEQYRSLCCNLTNRVGLREKVNNTVGYCENGTIQVIML